MKKDNIIQEKSYLFALKVVKITKLLIEEEKEYVLSKQLLRSATSIGANIEEAIGGQSKRDFIAKVSISYKEAREAHYWIRLLIDADYLKKDKGNELLKECQELKRIMGAILKTSKNNL